MNTTTLTSIPLTHREMSLTNCCPIFNPADWDNKVFELDHKLFAKVSTHSFLHVPLDMSHVMRNAQHKISEAGAETDEFAILSFEASPWHADHYITVSKSVPGMEMVELTGTFMSRVFEGPYGEINNWYRDLINYVTIRNKIPSRPSSTTQPVPAALKLMAPITLSGWNESKNLTAPISPPRSKPRRAIWHATVEAYEKASGCHLRFAAIAGDCWHDIWHLNAIALGAQRS